MVKENGHRFFLLVLPLFMWSQALFAQSSLTGLKRKRLELEKEIKFTNQLISKVGRNKKNTLYSLTLISNKIIRRQELAATLKKEVFLLSDSISSLNIGVKKLNIRLVNLKDEYGRIAYYVYKNDNAYTRLIFLFSARDINQAYQRLRYLSEISSYIRKEAEHIKSLEYTQAQKKEELEKRIIEKKKFLDMEVSQLSLLQLEQQKKNRVKGNLLKQERLLRRKLGQKRRESILLNRKIEDAIAKATAKARKRSKIRHTSTASHTELRLSASFFSNRGKLPWPVHSGIISQTFGVHNHPVLKYVKIRNDGINIATAKGTIAKAVFRGTVVSVVPITSTNIAIIVKHGNYFTVFAGLDKTFVRNGERLQAGKALGVVHTNLQGKTELHFELWKGKQFQNPAGWFSGRSPK